MTKRILLLNQGKTKNLGDIAINETISTFLNKQNIIVDNELFWSEENVYGKNYNKYPKIIRKILWCSKTITDILNYGQAKKIIDRHKYDTIIIGGGELLSSHFGFNSSIRVWGKIAKKTNIPLIIFGVSGNKLKGKEQKRIVQSLSIANNIIVRDEYTKQLLEENGITQCVLYPDVAFYYKELFEKETANVKKRGKCKNIILCPICYYQGVKEGLNLKNEKQYIDYLIGLISPYNNSHIYLCNTTPDDEQISNKLCSILLKKRYDVEMISYKDDVSSFIKIIKNSRIVISGRMHAMILGKIYGCKVTPIPFKKKLIIFDKEHTNGDSKKAENGAHESLVMLSKLVLEEHEKENR